MTHHGPMRWYNPVLDDFEWRAVPPTDEQAFEALAGSPACTETYHEWRELGAPIMAAFIRAGEAAKAEREHEKQKDGDYAR